VIYVTDLPYKVAESNSSERLLLRKHAEVLLKISGLSKKFGYLRTDEYSEAKGV
jgi:hypothetical protein